MQSADRFYLEDSRRIQRETELLASRAQEIRRLLGVGADVRDLIDASVRQAVETKAALDKFKDYQMRADPVSRAAQHQRLSGSLQNAVKDLETVVALYAPATPRPKTPARAAGAAAAQNPFTPGSAGASASGSGSAGGSETAAFQLEEGLKRGAVADLQRVEREMVSLQKIYQALHGQALEQQRTIETIAGNLVSAESSTAQANKQLLVSQERQDKSLKLKIYIFIFVLVLLLIYALLS